MSPCFHDFMDANRYHVNLINSFASSTFFHLRENCECAKSTFDIFLAIKKTRRFRSTWIYPPSSSIWISLFGFNDFRFSILCCSSSSSLSLLFIILIFWLNFLLSGVIPISRRRWLFDVCVIGIMFVVCLFFFWFLFWCSY